MGMAYMGLTHCEKCYKPLKDDEYVFCKKCEEENRKKDKSMKMKYKGYELLKAIADGKIKEGTRFKAICYTFIVKCGYLYKECNITLEYADSYELMWDFELIEDEIDIDSIIELEEFELDQFVTMDKSERFDRTMIEYSKINQLLQAVKQLNKKVKELENRIN